MVPINTDGATAGNTQPQILDIPNDAEEFVDLFFFKGKVKQKESLKAILTYQRVTDRSCLQRLSWQQMQQINLIEPWITIIE